MIRRISPEEAKERLDSGEGYIYLDVRDVSEYEAGHPVGARNIPVLERGPLGMTPNDDFLDVCEANFEKDQKIITGCLRGGRSLRAAQMLASAGFTEVVDMQGGFDGETGPGGEIIYEGWARRGLPVSSEPAPGATYEELKKSGNQAE
jgi:rhodanese-related sulfurtransferase